ADCKIYLDASAEERAKRRHVELVDRGVEIAYADVLSSILERDEKDRGRDQAPLVIPEGGVVVCTDHLGVEEVLQRVLAEVRNHCPGPESVE
ncbi:MAG: (d)CMP kinase, partial [Planctomycetota bacterium]